MAERQNKRKKDYNHSDGITYDCSNLRSTYLPELPVTLKILKCDHNYLTSLPTLPPGLEVLDCGKNNLTQLPELPVTLKELYCKSNYLTSLPTLPPGLEVLDCELAYDYDYDDEDIPNNNRFVLPNLPNTLIELNCQSNRLTALPSPLPHDLKVLDCTGNYLTALPSPLPENLEKLYCNANDGLHWLPNLPSSIKNLSVDVNNLEIQSLRQIQDIIKNGAVVNYGYYKDLQRIVDRIQFLQRQEHGYFEVVKQIQTNNSGLADVMSVVGNNLAPILPTRGRGKRSIKKKTNRKRVVKKKTIKRKTRKY